MTVTRHPTGQDLMCLVCHKPAQDIDHVQNRGSGGSKERDVPENKVSLCRECHTAKTNGVLETRVREARFTNRPWALFYEWRRRTSSAPWITIPVEVSNRYKCLVKSEEVRPDDAKPSTLDQRAVGRDGQVLSAAAEKGAGNPDTRQDNVTWAAALSAKEEDDGTASGVSDGDVRRPSVGDVPVGDSISSSPLTHEQRVAIAANIRDAEWNRQWFAGDTALAWEAEIGERANQYICDFGYVELSMSNLMRVCERIPPPSRNANLRFSHHVVVADLNREDMEMWLDECEKNEWSVAEFRRQVKGTKARVKRWDMQQLQLGAAEWIEQALNNPMPSAEIHPLIRFLDWLGEQE